MFDPDHIPDELLPYKEKLTPSFFSLRTRIINFIQEDIMPSMRAYKKAQEEVQAVTPFAQPPMLKELQAKAKARGLWNMFLPENSGVSVLEYAPIAELLGAVPLANIAMNCAAPDTGNMEVLEKFGTDAQKKRWLEPLLNGDIRSAFAMTEPAVASSDATNICSTIKRVGGEYVVNGHKWYISGACRPECKVFIFLGRTATEGPKHGQQTMLIIPRDTPGIKILRPLGVFGHIGDHAEIVFDDVRVPLENVILGEGRGFEIAQGRLGPGRIHHCMRTCGVAEMGLAAIIHRSKMRSAFGGEFEKKDNIRRIIAESRIEITKCRQLCYLAACMMDEKGAKNARKYIAMIKVAAPRMALQVVDEAIQVHGAHGVSQDSRLPGLWTSLRTLRVADGPDIVHMNTIAKMEIGNASGASNPFGKAVSGTNKNIEKYAEVRARL